MIYNLAIAYRVYPGNPKIPAIVYPCDKFNLVRICFYSLIQALGPLTAKFYVILDNCPSYEVIFREFVADEHLIIEHQSGAGNPKTFELQLEWLVTQRYSSNVFLAEDDYLYLPLSLGHIVNFMHSNSRLNYFYTPYDHPDYYTLKWHNVLYPSTLVISENHTFISRASTTCTFIATQTTLKSAQKIFLQYRFLGDIGVWFLLTAKSPSYTIKTIISLLRSGTSFPISFLIKSLYHKLLHKLWRGQDFTLWSCTPSAATHVESKYLSAHVDWHSLVKQYQSDLAELDPTNCP
jgi:hypothetical protein